MGSLRLEIHNDPCAIAGAWHALEGTGFGTLFQSYAWVSTWCRTAARDLGEEPVFPIWYKDDGSAAIIWPMAITTWRGSRVLTWLGQGYTNYNMGLYHSDIAGEIDAGFMRQAVAEIGARLPAVSALHLTDQPLAWNGQPNPFAKLPHQPSANVSFEMTLQEDPNALIRSALSNSTRRSLERLERRLKERGVAEFGIAEGLEQRQEVFSAFMRQRAAQFEKMNVANHFSHPAIRAFYKELFMQQSGAPFESAFLKFGGKIVATSNGMKFQDRFYHLTLSMSLEGGESLSPGRLLSREQVAHQCRQKIAVFDFGPGTGRHKEAWHPRPLAYMETYLPLRRSGAVITVLRSATARGNAMILSSPSMQRAISAMKKARRKLSLLYAGK